MTRFRLWLACLCLFAPSLAHAEKVLIGMPEWCPYTCEDPERPGLMVELTRDILKAQGIEAEFEIYENWNRLVYDARKGRKIDALLATSAAEVPELVYPEESMIDVLISFFIRSDSPWRYTGPESFEGHLLLGFENLYYGAKIQPYIEANKHDRTKVELATGETEEVFMNKVAHGRGDIYLEDKNVGLYMIKHEGLAGRIKLASGSAPIDPLPLSVGFSPKRSKASEYARFLSEGVRQAKKDGTYDRLIKQYIE